MLIIAPRDALELIVRLCSRKQGSQKPPSVDLLRLEGQKD